MQGTQKNQNNLEKESKLEDMYFPISNLLLNYRKQDSVLLGIKTDERSTEENSEFRNTCLHLQLTDFPCGCPKQINGERIVFSTNSAGTTE
jgi:hypothetical protein